jgi:serine/threonine protein kinase
LLDTDTAYTAHERAYREGVLHRDISPDNILIVDGRGLLIDWDMCKEKNGKEGQIGYRTSRTVRANSSCLDLIDAKPGPQGTWPFMAADLVNDKDHEVTQTFIHDLESAFYVLLYQALRYRHINLTPKKRSTLFFQVFDTRTVGGLGSGTKFTWMSHPVSLKDFQVLDSSGGPCNLKQTLGHRHFLKEYPEQSGLSAFLDNKDYEALPYKHSDIIGLFSGALKSSDWPIWR